MGIYLVGDNHDVVQHGSEIHAGQVTLDCLEDADLQQL
jgi:hypothetical protein